MKAAISMGLGLLVELRNNFLDLLKCRQPRNIRQKGQFKGCLCTYIQGNTY